MFNVLPEGPILQIVLLFLLFVFVPFFIVVIFPIISYLYKKIFYTKLSPKMVTLFVKVASYDETNFKLCDQLFAGLYGIKRPFYETILGLENRISLEIVGKSEGIFFYVTCPERIQSFVEKQIYGTYKVAEIEFIPIPKVFDRGTVNVIYELKQEMGQFTLINSFDEKTDPLKTIVSTMTKLDPNEVLAYQLIISPAPSSWIKTVRGILANSSKEGAYLDPAYKESLEKKIGKQGFYSTIRLLSISTDINRATINIENIYSALGQFNNPKTNSLVKKFFMPQKSTIRKFILRQMDILDIHVPLFGIKLYLNTCLFNTEELSNLYHFANKDLDITGIKRTDFKKTSAPGNLPTEGIIMGKNKFRDVETLIRIKEKDRVRHTYILGQTGSGKSVFLFSQALQDIYNGEGICVLDPHGPDMEELLSKIPPHREKDVIYFNAADFERPIGINILEVTSTDPHVREIQQNMIINNLIELLRKLYDPQNQGIVGPQFEESVRNCMLTCMVDPESTLVDVVQLLQDEKKAEKFLPKITDQSVIDYWRKNRASMTEQTKSEMMGYLTSKFSKFTQDVFMRNIVAQSKSSINIPDIMDNRKILLINLAKGKIGQENSQFLGLLLVPKILQSAMSRAEKISKGEKFPVFYLYVDEFQNFATDAFESILSEARKFLLGLTVANQYINQLSDKIKNAVFGNVGSSVFFRVGAEDAAFCKKMMDSFEERDFQYLKLGNAYVKLLVDGAPTKPFSMLVDYEIVSSFKADPETRNRIIQTSRQTYGKSIQDIEHEIQTRYADLPENLPNQGIPANSANQTPNPDAAFKFDDDFFAGL